MSKRIPSSELFKAIIGEAEACLRDCKWDMHLEFISRCVDVLKNRISDWNLWSETNPLVAEILREVDDHKEVKI